MPTLRPAAVAACNSAAASRGVRIGSRSSRGRAVVASTNCRSATAPSSRANTVALSSGQVAPEAVAHARSWGQPPRGRTSLRPDSPKFAIALATAPMFSASCGSFRMTTGAVKSSGIQA